MRNKVFHWLAIIFVAGTSLCAFDAMDASNSVADPVEETEQDGLEVDAAENENDSEEQIFDNEEEGPSEFAVTGNPSGQENLLNERDQQNLQDYLQGISAGPVTLPTSHGVGGRPAVPSLQGILHPPALPLPFVAPKGNTCGQMLATSVGGTMDNVVGISTGTILGGFGHNVLGPAAGNLIGGVLVNLC